MPTTAIDTLSKYSIQDALQTNKSSSACLVFCKFGCFQNRARQNLKSGTWERRTPERNRTWANIFFVELPDIYIFTKNGISLMIRIIDQLINRLRMLEELGSPWKLPRTPKFHGSSQRHPPPRMSEDVSKNFHEAIRSPWKSPRTSKFFQHP